MAFSIRSLLVLVVVVATLTTVPSLAEEICTSDTGVFTAVLDMFAGELGYFTFKECPGLLNPTIGIELGQTYTFDQSDRSNWYHPMGFAYFPDGAHDEKDELEKVITQTNSDCLVDFSCPAPLYHLNGEFLGVNGTSDFGLDVYEPDFFLGVVDWVSKGNYTIKLTFDDEAYTQDIFYFCHIHQFMTGRIKILKDGVPVSAANEPPLPYNYDTTSEFDATCGTHGLDLYQLPNSQCPEQFVCTAEDVTPEFQQFASCIDAMNCHMMAGMTSGSSAQSPTALFLHQMIPHHQNAVNMAKTLMNYKGEILCDDLTNDADPICVMEAVLRDIINTQNYQIQQMRGILESMNYNSTDDCAVTITTEREIIEGSAPTPSTTTASAPTPSATSGVAAVRSFIVAMSSATMLVLVSLFL